MLLDNEALYDNCFPHSEVHDPDVLRFQPRFHGLEDAESRLDVLSSIGHYTFLVNWISETGGCHLRRRVVAVSAKRLEVGQVSRRRVVAVFGDGWLPSLPSVWVLDRYLGDGVVAVSAKWLGVVRYLGDGWLPSSETGGCRLEMRTGTREKGGSTASVPPLKSKRNVGKANLDLRLVCAPVSWRLFPGVLGVWAALAFGLLFRFCVWGLVPSCAPGLVALSGFVHRVCFKKR